MSYKIGSIVFDISRIKLKNTEKFLITVHRGDLSDEEWDRLRKNLQKELDGDEPETSPFLWKDTCSVDEMSNEEYIINCLCLAISDTFPDQNFEKEKSYSNKNDFLIQGAKPIWVKKSSSTQSVKTIPRNKWYQFHTLDQVIDFVIELGAEIDVDDPDTLSILSDLITILIPGIQKLETTEIEELPESGTRIAWANIKHLFD